MILFKIHYCLSMFAMYNYLISVLVLLGLFIVTYGANIFAYIPTASYSHQVVYQPIWKELVLRGHKVTLLTTNTINDPSLTNLTEVDLSFSYKMISNVVLNDLIQSSSILENIKKTWNFMNSFMSVHLESPEVQKFIHEGTFDLVIAEYLTTIPFAFAEKFKCPSIAVTSFAPMEFMYRDFGMPTHPVLYPDYMMSLPKPKSLLERTLSVLYDVYFVIYNRLINHPYQEQLLKKYFGQDTATPIELVNKISLLLENTIPGFHPVRPLGPLVVSIGGIHRVPAKPLPKELQTILDSASNGFIYFSLGSNVKSNARSNTFKKVILETFAELPYTIIWKFESENLNNVPNNVVIKKWFPQTDILRHHNIKLFITQGGLQSIEEAFTSKVPVIGIPFIADQFRNIMQCVEHGFGLFLDHNTMDKNIFKKAILEVLTNPKYRETIAEASDLSNDQPISSLDKAVWWIEYVIRHNGTEHLRSPVLDIPWYQYYMIDVVGISLMVLALVLYLGYMLVHIVLRIIKLLVCKILTLKKKVD